MKPSRAALAILCLLITVGSGVWTWKHHFAAPPINKALHQGVGEALAQEVADALGGHGRLVLVTLPDSTSDIVATHAAAFRAALARRPELTLAKVETVDPENKPKYGPGSGLSASRLLRLAKKYPDADALVSLIGVPEMSPEELAALTNARPRLIACVRDVKKVAPLLAAGRLERAIVPRFQFPAPVEGEPRNPREWFDLQFQVVTAAHLARP